MLSSTGFRPVSQVVMSPTHRSTWGPLIRVSAKAMRRSGDSNPGTPLLATMYSRKSFMKALALSQSPSNVLGRFPITFISAGTGIGTRWLGGITSPCPGGPGGPSGLPPPPGFPPGGPPQPGAVRQRAVARVALSCSLASGAAGAAGGGPAGAAGALVMEGPVLVVSPGARVVTGAVVVVPIVRIDVVWLGLRGEQCCLVGVMSGAHGSLSGQCGLPGPFGLIIASAFLVSWVRGSSLLSSGRLECMDLSKVSSSGSLAWSN